MASLVKTKKSIFFISVIITVTLWVAETSLFKTTIIKRWDDKNPLSWEDFQGDVPVFDKYDAAIYSEIYVDSNGTAGRHAYAGQHNLKSWTKYTTESEDLLRHEQYHFNITELHARKLNEFIRYYINSGKPVAFDSMKSRIVQKSRKMQVAYDQETDHSVKTGWQNLWEFKIDSMLSDLETGAGAFTDYFGGTQIWFPATPTYHEERGNNYLSTEQSLFRYGVSLEYKNYYDIVYESSFSEEWISYLEGEAFDVRKFNHLRTPYYEKLNAVFDDTIAQWRYHQDIYLAHNNEYIVSAVLPLNDPDSLIYNRIKDSYFNQFLFDSQEAFWINHGLKNQPVVYENNPVKDYIVTSSDYYTLSRLPQSDFSIMYHQPIPIGDTLLIPFKVVRHPYQDVREILFMINENRNFSQTPDSPYQMVKVDMDLLQEGSNKIQFGYTTHSDSTAQGYHFYSSIVVYHK